MKLRQVDLDEINKLSKNTMLEVLGMECIETGDNFIRMKMPVESKTHQPMGLLHGGASVALIESVGSMGSALILDPLKEAPVGLEVNANHVSSVKSGNVIATGTIVHAGRRTHLWQVDIHDEASGKLVCTGRLTVMVVRRA